MNPICALSIGNGTDFRTCQRTICARSCGPPGHLVETHERDLGRAVRHHERDPLGPAELFEHGLDGSRDGDAVRDVVRRERWDDGTRRQDLADVLTDTAVPAAAGEDDPGHPRRRHLQPDDGRRRRPPACERCHVYSYSTNVTLLISRKVVRPVTTRSTAHSRRNRMPSSRATRLISEFGRRSRIISRMRSLRSSNSQMAVRPL